MELHLTSKRKLVNMAIKIKSRIIKLTFRLIIIHQM